MDPVKMQALSFQKTFFLMPSDPGLRLFLVYHILSVLSRKEDRSTKTKEPCTEADAMADSLVKKGISPGRIPQEPKAASTLENLEFSKQYRDCSRSRIGIVTNQSHLFRSVFYCQEAAIHGRSPYPCRKYSRIFTQQCSKREPGSVEGPAVRESVMRNGQDDYKQTAPPTEALS